jgi:hypothetical protein
MGDDFPEHPNKVDPMWPNIEQGFGNLRKEGEVTQSSSSRLSLKKISFRSFTLNTRTAGAIRSSPDSNGSASMALITHVPGADVVSTTMLTTFK